MKLYKIGDVARLSGVSIRALRHYHAVGLLVPVAETESGYRLYNSHSLLLLQQIILFKECGLALAEIKVLLIGDDLDLGQLLQQHKMRIEAELSQKQQQLHTLNQTIKRIQGETMAIEDTGLYAGFKDAKKVRTEAIEKYGDKVNQVEKKLAEKTDDAVKKINEEGELIAKELSVLVSLPVDDDRVQALMLRQLAWLQNYYEVNRTTFEGLADMYLSDPRFAEFYDKHGAGMAEFMNKAMQYFATQYKWD